MISRFNKTIILTSITVTIIYLFILPKHSNVLKKGSECNPSQAASLESPKSASTQDQFDPESIRKTALEAQLLASENAYQRYVVKRKGLVKSNPSKVNPWPPNWVMYYWDYFLPSFTCPYMTERIGGLGDGGKWVCGFHLFETGIPVSSKGPSYREPCVVYSFGVSTESSYEAEILRRTNCSIYAYDASVDKMGPQVSGNNPRVHFSKLYIGPKNTNTSLTLKTLMDINGHLWIDFLKMDVEGGEVDVLNQIIEEFVILPFGQLQIEIHTDQKGSNFPKVYKLWEKMEKKGLRAFKNEVNHWPCVRVHMNPMYVEYSFINLKGKHRLVR